MTKTIACLCLLLAACGGSDDSVPATGATAPYACANCAAGTGGTTASDAGRPPSDAPIGAATGGSAGQPDARVDAPANSDAADACASCADAPLETSPGTGGSQQTGGSTGSGGATETGGMTGSGGSDAGAAAGGDAGTGGSTETGGSSSTGGATGTGGTTQPPPQFPGPDGGGAWEDWGACLSATNPPDTSCCLNIHYGTYTHVLMCADGFTPPHPPCWQAVGSTWVCDPHL